MGSIGIFDSGIGGFTILKDLVKVFDDQNMYYVADQKHIPYSSKSEEFLIDRSIEITKFLKDKGCSTIVAACNTVTVFAIDDLRKHFKKLNFVGVEPAIKTAAKTKKGEILVLATQNTIKSKRLEKLINEHTGNKIVHYQDMSNWVLWAEKGMIKKPFVEKYTREKFKQFENREISSVVLACTHYPLYTSLIKKIFNKATIIDPSEAVAKQAKKIHEGTKVKKPKIKLFSTKSLPELKRTSSNLLSFPVEVEYISL